MRQRILPSSPAQAATTSSSSETAGATLVLDGTPPPAPLPQRGTGSEGPHGWRLLVLVDATSRAVLATRLTSADGERSR